MIFYDFEVFIHDWLVVLNDTDTQQSTVIVNDPEQLKQFHNEHRSDIWVGYNSRHYDQYILKAILCDFDPKEVNDFIIVQKKGGWSYSRLFMKIQLNNFDIMTGFHGLKQLEAFMGNDIRESDVPFNLDRKLAPDELQSVIKYCRHDVEQTMEVFLNRLEEFESQVSLLKAFNLPLANIGKTKAQLSAIILGAKRLSRDDEFDITIPDTLRVKKYKHVVDWYSNPDNRDYKKSLTTDVSGVEHVFAWGGIHGAIPNYQGKGIFVNIDVASYYPALMIEYGFSSRNIADPDKYRQIRDERIRLKAEKNPMQAPYKIVLNGTYGAMKDKYNQLYDPLQANNVCVGGQLLLLDLIECLEGSCELIQSNTDGLIVKVRRSRDIDKVKSICAEWEQRTRMVLEFETFERIYQKDVNNYLIVHENGTYKSKGAYVKELDVLDYDLAIVNKAIVEYFIHGVPPERTIMAADKLIDFQKIVKVSEKYSYAIHCEKRRPEKVLRVFASRGRDDGTVYKMKMKKIKGGPSELRPEKFANTPEKCFILNEDINNIPIPRKLDRKWYIDVANKRIEDFLK
ncbi:DNA polymerase II [compost metagenome]